jgi:hypothetical protein
MHNTSTSLFMPASFGIFPLDPHEVGKPHELCFSA